MHEGTVEPGDSPIDKFLNAVGQPREYHHRVCLYSRVRQQKGAFF